VNKNCQGCRYAKVKYVIVTVLCVIARAQSEKTCPCATCLVKIMCTTNCDKRVKKRQELREEIKRERDMSWM
jgi:hypothetical protein